MRWHKFYAWVVVVLSVLGTAVPSAAQSLTVTANPTSFENEGDTIQLTYSFNSGNRMVSSLSVASILGVSVDCPFSPLATNQTWACTRSYTISTWDYSAGFITEQASFTYNSGSGGNSNVLRVGRAGGSTSTSVTASPNPSTYGTPVTLSATVTPNGSGTPSGTVTFSLSSAGATTDLGAAPLVSGRATFSSSTFPIGTHTVYATYNGDSAYSSSLGMGSFTVNPSSNADLASLSLSQGTLSPAFSSGTTSYSTSVVNGVTSLTVTPTSASSVATIRLNGSVIASGATSAPIPLSVGSNPISISLTAQDGTTTKTYIVNVTRVAAAVANDQTVNVGYNQQANFTLTGSGAGAVTYSQVTAPTKGTLVLNSNGTGSYTPSAGTSGTDTFEFQVTDSHGQTAVGTVTLLVAAPQPAPVVTGVSVPPAALYKEADALTFTVTFSQPVSVTGSPAISISLGGATRSAPYVGGSGSNTLTFTYTVQGGDAAPSGITVQSLSLSGGTIVNAESTAAGLILNNVPSTAGILVDAVAPTFTATQAVAGTAANATSLHFTVTFSEPVTGVSTSDFALVATGTASGSITSLSGSGTTFDVTVSSVSGVGSLRLDGLSSGNIRDAAGNRLVTSFSGGVPWNRTLSGNANLSALALSAGSLNPAFSSNVTSYTVQVGNTVTSITLTPTVAESNASVTMNGHVVGSGSASAPISLALGSTAVTIVVTAQDGTTRTYTVTVNRAASDNAALATLTSSSGALSPAFDSATLAYTVTVDNAVTSLTLTPSVAEPNATITVAGQVVANGSASSPITLAVGANAIPVVVTAQDGVTTRTYTINVVRAPSEEAKLASLSIDVGTLKPAFDAQTFVYTMAVGHDVTSLTLSPSALSPGATLTVNGRAAAMGPAAALTANGRASASGAGITVPLTVGANIIEILVTAQDGVTTAAYTITVTRAPSANASLAGLVPSAGTLSPAFAPGTLAYTISLDHAVPSLQLTPRASEPNATITVGGQAVASGSASQPIPLAVGTTSIPVVVTAQDGATQVTYSIAVARLRPAPTVVSRTIEIYAGETATLDLTEGATGGPFTGANIVAPAADRAGSARVESAAGRYHLIFTSNPSFSGTAKIGFALSNASGPSAPGTITFSVLARPDPSKDPEVQGLLRAQVETAKRLVRTQTRNFNNRLEQLHHENDRRRNSFDVQVSLGDNEDTMDPGLRAMLGERARTSGKDGGALNDWSAFQAPSRSWNDASRTPSTVSDGSSGTNLGRYALWSGGYVNFGQRGDAGLDLSSTTVGLSGGIDYRFASNFVAGFGLGYGHDATDIGTQGTRSRATAYSGAVYASYQPVPSLFLDALVGGSWLNLDATRFVTTNSDIATGNRDGRQLFGSLTAAYEIRTNTWLVSPYGRLEMSRSWLDGYTEEGGGIFALAYGGQKVDTLSGILGLRAEYSFDMAWGRLTPGARVEYTYDFEGSSRVGLGYADLDVLTYSFEIEPSGRDHATFGLSLDAEMGDDWSFGLDYRTSFGKDEQNHTLGGKLGRRF